MNINGAPRQMRLSFLKHNEKKKSNQIKWLRWSFWMKRVSDLHCCDDNVSRVTDTQNNRSKWPIGKLSEMQSFSFDWSMLNADRHFISTDFVRANLLMRFHCNGNDGHGQLEMKCFDVTVWCTHKNAWLCERHRTNHSIEWFLSLQKIFHSSSSFQLIFPLLFSSIPEHTVHSFNLYPLIHKR